MRTARSRRKCAYCGTVFVLPTGAIRDWGYAVGDRACCSYRCMRAEEKEQAERKLRRIRGTLAARIYTAYAAGATCQEMEERFQLRAKDIYMRMMMLEAMHPEEARAIREQADRQRRTG